MERCHLVSVCWIFMIIAIFPDLLSATTTIPNAETTSESSLATASTTVQPAETTSETQPNETTSESQPTETTSETQPTETTSETQLNVTTSESQPTETTSETQPTVTTSDTQPTAPTSETQPNETTSESQPTVTTSETQPTETTSETQLNVTTSESQPTETTSETQPTVTTSDTQPTAPTSETQPNVTTSESQPTVTTSETQATAPTSETQTTAPTSETQTTAPTSETQTTAPTSETQTTAPTSDTQPTVTTSETQPTAPTSDTQPTVTTSDTQPTSQSSQPTETSQSSQPTETTQSSQPTDTSQSIQPTETTLSTESSTVSSTDLTTLPSTAQSTVPSTDAPVTGGFKPDLDNLIIKLDFTISIGLAFNTKLKNKTSNDYKDLEKQFIDKLEPIYAKLEGFVNITILEFRSGSTEAVHQVEVEANSNDVTEETLTVTSSEIQNITINNTTVIKSIDVKDALKQFEENCNDICGRGLKCDGEKTGSPYCVCEADNCKNDGICRAHSKGVYSCSCKSTDDHVFSGDHCEISTRKYALNEGAIIGIASGLGGGVLILVIVIFGCLRCAKARKNKDIDSQSVDGDLPELSFPNLDKMRMSQLNQGNDYDGKGMPNYGFEPQPTDLRYHRKFDHGRDQGTFFQRKEMDYSPRGSQNMKREMYSGETSYNSYDELNALDNPESRLSRDFSRSSNLRRSSYNQTDEPRSGDSRRSSQMRSKGNDPDYQLLTGSIREGDSVFQHINTERPYTIMRPNFR